jgi:hypothetical protein
MMMSRLTRLLSRFQVNHLLIIILFILERNNEFFPDIPFTDSLKLFSIFLIAGLLIFIVCIALFREEFEAGIISLVLLFIVLYAKTLYINYSRLLANGTRISNTHFFIVLGVITLLLILWIKRSTLSSLKKFSQYLKILFLTLIVYEAGSLIYKTLTPQKQLSLQLLDLPSFSSHVKGPKPDIYLLLFDEYQGNDGLKELFGFRNLGPDSMLISKGFRVLAHPRSNYNFTFYSVPSMLNMAYLSFSDHKIDYNLGRVIKSVDYLGIKNSFLDHLNKQGYTIINHSFFRLYNTPSQHSSLAVQRDGYSAVFSRTLPGWAQEDLLHFIPANSLQRFLQTYYYQTYQYNLDILNGLTKTINSRAIGPKFVYGHFLLPHTPVLTDSTGKLKNISSAMYEINQLKPSLNTSYAGYLKYTNQVLEKLVTEIRAKDSNAVIIFTSDHGFRSFPDRQTHVFNTQCAVYIPGNKYEGFNDSTSLVNLMRLVLNNALGQKIPLTGDTTHLVK